VKSTARVLVGDCIEQMRTLPDGSVNCCVTSPPYFGLRDYGHAGQIGLEPTPDAYVAKMVEVFREVRRVLRDDGVLWLNLGDTYAANRTYQVTDNKHIDVGNNGGTKVPDGLKPKDLIGIPWRVAFALQQPYYTGVIRNERDRVWLAGQFAGIGADRTARSHASAGDPGAARPGCDQSSSRRST